MIAKQINAHTSKHQYPHQWCGDEPDPVEIRGVVDNTCRTVLTRRYESFIGSLPICTGSLGGHNKEGKAPSFLWSRTGM